MPRVLVVANQTVASTGLLDAIESRMAKGPCQFTLLVPATAHAHLSVTDTRGLIGAVLPPRSGDAAYRADYDHARNRLEFGLEQLRRLGADVDGDVGEGNPIKAVQDALERRPYDEIILSTLPSGISRWLSQDLPHKLTRKFKLPLTVVTPADTA